MWLDTSENWLIYLLNGLNLMRCLVYQVTESAEEITEGETYQSYKYPTMMKTRSGFKLSVMKGSFNDSQIIVLLGENGTGKTTVMVGKTYARRNNRGA